MAHGCCRWQLLATHGPIFSPLPSISIFEGGGEFVSDIYNTALCLYIVQQDGAVLSLLIFFLLGPFQSRTVNHGSGPPFTCARGLQRQE